MMSLCYNCIPVNIYERFDNKLDENQYIINTFPNIDYNKPNKYIIYNKNKSIIESNNTCKWECKRKNLTNIVKKGNAIDYDHISIIPINGYTYHINCKMDKDKADDKNKEEDKDKADDKNKEEDKDKAEDKDKEDDKEDMVGGNVDMVIDKTFIFKKTVNNKYKIYEDTDEKYDVIENMIENKKVISIRDTNFNPVARITFDTKVNDTFKGYNNVGEKFVYNIIDESFKDNIHIGYSIFELINEINRDKYI